MNRCIFVLFGKKKQQTAASPGGLEPPALRLTAERANPLRHGDLYEITIKKIG